MTGRKVDKQRFTIINAFVEPLNCGIFMSFPGLWFGVHMTSSWNARIIAKQQIMTDVILSRPRKMGWREKNNSDSSICKTCLFPICMYVIPLVRNLVKAGGKKSIGILPFSSATSSTKRRQKERARAKFHRGTKRFSFPERTHNWMRFKATNFIDTLCLGLNSEQQ